MNSVQFEELCRFFVARRLGLAVEGVRWLRVPAAVRPGEQGEFYQVDLCWETEDEMGRYMTIADAKWRVGHKVDRDDVLLLEQFRIGAGAHKAVMMSNAVYTSGAVATARRLGIALHRLLPLLSCDAMPAMDRPAIQSFLTTSAAAQTEPICEHHVVCKALGLGIPHSAGADASAVRATGAARKPAPARNRVMSPRTYRTTAWR